ncbi:MAG TPA: MBL fold metallo-hydrolase [Abditibacteriaceae bacterium]|jgi:phosphoribosyl 1,2-cyclic phosphate phosphodiesterase
MTIRFLGTGTSYGVPLVGCDCAVCTSTDARDKRLRASIFVENGDTRILVDTTPDLRQQLLASGVRSISTVLWTHAHNDHVIGLDDLRPISDFGGYIPGYAREDTLAHLRNIFSYVFVEGREHGGFPRVTPHVARANEAFQIGSIQVTPLEISHGRLTIFAYQFEADGKRFVYSTDCSQIPDESRETMRGCDLFVVDALRHRTHPTHFSVEQALEEVEKIAPQRTFFTHIAHDLAHAETEAMLPSNVRLACDGLNLQL